LNLAFLLERPLLFNSVSLVITNFLAWMEQTVEQRLSNILRDAGAAEFIFRTVPSDYYERTYEERRDLLGAASVEHLCKSIVMVRLWRLHFCVKAYFIIYFLPVRDLSHVCNGCLKFGKVKTEIANHHFFFGNSNILGRDKIELRHSLIQELSAR